jgi:hypothetical protein
VSIRYDIKGGKGLLPFYPGNKWEYAADYSPETLCSEVKIEVSFADDKRTILSVWQNSERFNYDENSWHDMVEKITQDYYREDKDGREYLCDVHAAVERAEKLAETPMEKAHTKAAASVARRILDTDPTINPDHTATGHWNFF